MVHLGHPEHPAPGLERALLEGASSLIVTAAVAVPGQWVWVGAGATVGQVVIDEAGMRDCASVLRGLGASPRLVPTRATVEERIALAGEGGSLVIERSRVPAGFAELPDSAGARRGRPRLVRAPGVPWRLARPSPSPRRCGSRSARRTTTSVPCSRPSRSSRTPASTWTTCAASRRRPGRTSFFTSFSCPTSDALSDLVAALTERGVAHRTLAVLPGEAFVPGPDALTPRWA